MPKTMSNTVTFNDNAGTIIQNGIVTTNEVDVNGNINLSGSIDTSANITANGTITSNNTITANQVDVNGDINLTGSIVNGSNAIYFNEQYQFIDIPNNSHIYGTLFLDYGGTTYNVGDIISQGTSGTYASYPSITYDASTNTTTFTGAVVFPATSIDSTSINNSSFLTLTTNQNVSGSKTYSVSQIFTSDIRLDGALVLNTNTLSIPNTTLRKLQYISTISSDIQSQVTALQTKTTNISFAGTTTTFTGTLVFPAGSIPTNRITGTAINTISVQSINATKTFTVDQNFSANLRLDGNLVLFSGVSITQSQLGFLTGLSSSVQNQLDDVKLKTINQSASGGSTTFTGNLIGDSIVFNTFLNTVSPTTFNYISDLTSSAQFQINAVNTKADDAQSAADTAQSTATSAQNTANSAQTTATNAKNTADGASVTAGSAVITAGIASAAAASAVITAGIANTAAAGANNRCTVLEGRVDDHDGDIGALQVKTTRMSYNSATSKTTITNTLQASTLQLSSLNSGFDQNIIADITIRGETEIKNTLSITDGYGLNVDGGIQQLDNTPNAFNGTITANNNFTSTGAQTSLNSTNTQIGLSSVETLTVNSLSTFNNDVTIVANKKLVLKNIVPLGLDDIYFGGEAGAYVNYHCYFNMKSTFYEKVTIIDEVAIGTLAFRGPLTSYNDTVLIDASTSIDLESSITATLSAPIVNIGLVLGVNNLRGTTYIQNLATTSGVVNAIGTVMRQF
jgi:hypothetical protein